MYRNPMIIIRQSLFVLSMFIFCVPVILAQDVIQTSVIVWSPNGQYLAVASDQQIDIIEVQTQNLLNTFDRLSMYHPQPTWSPDSQMIGFGNGTDFEVWQIPWDAQATQKIAIFDNSMRSMGSIYASSWHPSEPIIAVSAGVYINLLNVTAQTIMPLPDGDHLEQIYDLAWDTSGSKLAIGRSFMIAEVWNMPSGESDVLIVLQPYLDGWGNYINPSVDSIDWSPDNHKVVYSGYEFFQSIDVDQLREAIEISKQRPRQSVTVDRTRFYGHTGNILSVDWHPTESLIASGGEDGTVRIWDANTGKELNVFVVGKDMWVRSVAWSPDGNNLAYGDGQGNVIILDCNIEEEIPCNLSEND